MKKFLVVVSAILFPILLYAMVQTTGVGQFTIPTAPAVGTTVTSGSANAFTTTSTQMIASTSAAIYITGVTVGLASTSKPTYMDVKLCTGASPEPTVGVISVPITYTVGATGTQVMGKADIFPPIPVANATRIACGTGDSVGSLGWTVTLQCINQANVVSGVTEKVDVDTIKTNPVVNAGTVTFPTSATLASTTNITGGTITTATTCTTCSALTTNNDKTGYALSTGGVSAIWQDTTAGDFTTSASVGKSIMNGVALGTGLTVNALTTNNDKTGYSLAANQHVIVDSGTVTTVTNQLTAAQIATGIWQDATAGDFTATASIGKSVMNGVSLGTGLTVNALTTNNDKTGYALTSAYDPAKTAAQAGDVMKVSSGTGANQISLSSGAVTVGTNNDKTGYSLTQAFPSNFSLLAIDGSGDVTFNNTIADPWDVTLPSTYTGQKAGALLYKVGNRPNQ